MVHKIYFDESVLVAREMNGSDYGLTYVLNKATRKVEVLFPINGEFVFSHTKAGSLVINDWLVQGRHRLEAGHPWCNRSGMCIAAEYDKNKPFYTKAVKNYCERLIA